MITTSKLPVNEKMIISKYLSGNDFINLINTISKLNTYFHTTFNYINLDANYVIPKHQVKLLIDKLLSTFPNLEEIILNITSEYIYVDSLNCIMKNYNNLNKCFISKNIKIKINFNQLTNLNFRNIDSNRIRYYLNFIKDIIKSTNNLYIIIDAFKKNNDNLLKFANEYKLFKFVKMMWKDDIAEANEANEANETNEANTNNSLKLLNKCDNIYYTNIYGTHIYHNDISILNNPYMKCYSNFCKTPVLIEEEIDNFKSYYNIMKLKRKLNNEPFHKLKIKYELNKSYYTEFTELHYESLKTIFNDSIYINKIYNIIANATHITFNDELFTIRNYYAIEDIDYMLICKKEMENENIFYIYCKDVNCKGNTFNPIYLIKDINNYWKLNNDLNIN